MTAMAMEELYPGQPDRRSRAARRLRQDDPAMLMAAASVDLPALVVTGGPMLTGRSAAGLGSAPTLAAERRGRARGRFTGDFLEPSRR